MLNCILAVVVEAGAAACAADEHDQAIEREKMALSAEARLITLCQGLDADYVYIFRCICYSLFCFAVFICLQLYK